VSARPPLRHRVWSARFRLRIDELQSAYRAARAQADADRARVLSEWADVEEAERRGEASIVDVDEEGNVLHDRGERVGELLHEVEVVLDLVRQAFTISLHHLWERELVRTMGVPSYREAAAFAHLRAQGASPDEPRLTALRLAANVAKHSGGPSARQLHQLRPDLFDLAEMARWGDPPSFDHLRISDEVLEEFFAAVRSSGPPGRGVWD
jgi:hypothetical protein